jgi:pyrroline-5-carboxylate reductase
MIAFIGSGNMAQAMFGGMIQGGHPAGEIVITGTDTEKLEQKKAKLGVNTTTDNKAAAQADIVVLAVKPHQFEGVIHEIKDAITDETLIISVAAGVTLSQMFEWFGKKVKLVRTMPNTPSLVGEGMAAIVPSELVTKEDLEKVTDIFNSFGKSQIVKEEALHGVIAVAGSSPAYVYMFIEALADGAVLQGIPRAQAYEFAAQAVMGAAKMVLETGQHPGALKDAVCSPGGTTIEAVVELEKSGMRQSVLSAMEACADKSRKMSGE